MSRPVEVGKPYRRIVDAQGRAYAAPDLGGFLTVDGQGRVWLHTPHVDVILNAPGPRYAHDGEGGIILEGAAGRLRLDIARARQRFEHIEAWRARVADYPLAVAEADACMASLLAAIDAAERA